MKTRMILKKGAVLFLAFVLVAGIFAIPALAQEETPETDSPKAAMKSIGNASEDTLRFEITNDTGKDIVYFSITAYDPAYYPNGDVVRLQEALIEQKYLDDVADGSYGPKTTAAVAAFREAKGLPADGGADEEMLTLLYGTYDDGNLLNENDIFAAGETRAVFFAPENKEEKKQEEPGDALSVLLSSYDVQPEYLVTFRLAKEQDAYVLHVFPAEKILTASLKTADGTAWLEYTAQGAEDSISTKDAEQAVYNQEHPAPISSSTGYDAYSWEYSDYDDYYTDAGWYDLEDDYYDYSQDAAQGADGCLNDDALTW